jgi:hypothetical protein
VRLHLIFAASLSTVLGCTVTTTTRNPDGTSNTSQSHYDFASKEDEKKPDAPPSGGGGSAAPEEGPTTPTIQQAMAQLGNALAPAQSKRVAVFPFPERGTGPTLLGEYVSDKLLVALGTGGKVELVERSRLEAVRSEQGMGVGGELDDSTAASIGNMAGADAVVVGTLTRVGSQWELTARLLGAEDAKILRVGETSFGTGAAPKGLAGAPVSGGGGGGRRSAASGGSARAGNVGAGEGGALLYEDFSSIEDGLVPDHWITDDGVGVGMDGRTKVLRWIARGEHKITIPNVRYPQDFEVELLVWTDDVLKITVGGATARIDYRNVVQLTNASEASVSAQLANKWVLFTVRKTGPVFKVLIDGTTAVTSRISTYEPPSSLLLDARSNVMIRHVAIRAPK